MKKVIGYKAFNKGLMCKDMVYKVGETYTTKEEIKLCESGFHFCENPIDVLDFYDLIDSEFGTVESIGKVLTDGKKSVTNKIKITAKLDLPMFIKASVDFLMEKCSEKPTKKTLVTRLNWLHLVTGLNWLHLVTRLDWLHLVTGLNWL